MIFPVTLAINWCQSPSQRYQIGDSWWYAPVNPHPHQSPFFHGETRINHLFFMVNPFWATLITIIHCYTNCIPWYIPPFVISPIDYPHHITVVTPIPSPSSAGICTTQLMVRIPLLRQEDGVEDGGWQGWKLVFTISSNRFLVFGWGFNMVYPTNIFFVMVSDRWWWLMMHLEAIDGPFVLFGDYHNHDPWNS